MKGSPTINPDHKYGVEQDHNFTIGPKLQKPFKRNQMMT